MAMAMGSSVRTLLKSGMAKNNAAILRERRVAVFVADQSVER